MKKFRFRLLMNDKSIKEITIDANTWYEANMQLNYYDYYLILSRELINVNKRR